MTQTILVLDFGSQTSHLILRRIRALNVYAEMLPCTTKLADLSWKPKGIILSGGPSSVYDKDAPHVDPAVFELGVPILRIAFGLISNCVQEIAWRINSTNVARGQAREYGHADVTIHKAGSHPDRLFAGLGDVMHAYMSHFDKLVQLPEGFVVVASTKNSEFAGIAHETKPIFGVQFHPELEHTPRGTELLRNFSIEICGAQPNWVMGDFVQQEIARIRGLVGDRAQVIGAVSGGVDSTVAAKLMTEAIGDRFHAILVDTGVMRLNECQEVKETLEHHLGINLTVVNAADLFLERLRGVVEPEKKRKTHHNVGGLPEDEVREIGRQLNIHRDLVMRHPFPGPGIAIRILGEVTQERVEIARKADHIYISMIKEAGIYDEMSQAYAGLDTNKGRFVGKMRLLTDWSIAAVGVQGDARVYGYIVILRAVTTRDFMSAEVYEFPWRLLQSIARRIVNEVEGVSRVTYDLTSKPPGTIELE
ncbi:GMP synthase [glutamine-hydrolyzing] protein-like protein [Colletotrichum chlorophyti]|uniref:GMP synthase [glutamine-hydrolyzing] n=1 Tax=Colletotrichum chlorophyti TaxID=708187 RepID=A0A1Q8S8I8_9PEZI|nr:GMP synthase [glutamine-hydrolyzing] protein-like protein [Colletotrichum chlorophyti]